MVGIKSLHVDGKAISILRLSGLILLLLMGGNFKGAAFGNDKRQPTRYVIVVTGGELLSGAYPDGHTYFLTRTLHPLGLQCVGSMSVDDALSDCQVIASEVSS